jgi:transposase
MNKTHGGKREGSGRKRTAINGRRAQILRAQGMSYREIAERFEVPKHVITYYFNFILPTEK